MKKNIYLIKFGGSIITDKNSPLKINFKAIDNLSYQIDIIKKENLDLNLIIGNGAGSFGHYYAKKYKINDNYVNFENYGFSKVNFSVRKLNLLIIEKLIEKNISCISFSPSSFLFSKNKKLKKIIIEPIINCLNQNIIPLVYGDIIFDEKLNSVIFSTERVFKELIFKLIKLNYKIKFIIYCSDVDGIYDENKKIINKINKNNFLEIKEKLTKYSQKYDVTGGIIHKIEESLELFDKFSIPSLIFNATKNNQLIRFFRGEKITGTFIK
ncbi:MAG: isopentenyl phosphate kinase [Patescibacteria group bacterium]|nr:isopentenyl phosphate kinase [Patescibacteria group bacterium]